MSPEKLIAALKKMADGYAAVAARWRAHPEIWGDGREGAAAVAQMAGKAATLREAIRALGGKP